MYERKSVVGMIAKTSELRVRNEKLMGRVKERILPLSIEKAGWHSAGGTVKDRYQNERMTLRHVSKLHTEIFEWISFYHLIINTVKTD